MSSIKKPVIGIIGGTGIYDIDGFENAQWVKIESAFGSARIRLLINYPCVLITSFNLVLYSKGSCFLNYIALRFTYKPTLSGFSSFME